MKVILSLFTYFVFDEEVKIIIIRYITLLAFTYPLNFSMLSLYKMILQATPSSLLIEADLYLIFGPSIVTGRMTCTNPTNFLRIANKK